MEKIPVNLEKIIDFLQIQAYDSSSDDTDATPHYKAIMKQLAAEKEAQIIVLLNSNCLTCNSNWLT